MKIIQTLICYGLRHALGEAVADTAEKAIEVLVAHFTDDSQALPNALMAANDRTWKALAVALAGDGFWDQCKRIVGVDQTTRNIRGQVEPFLHAAALDQLPKDFRAACLAELKALRESAAFKSGDFPAADFKLELKNWQRYGDPHGVVEGACQAVNGVASALEKHYPNLGRLLRQRAVDAPPLLASLFAFFLREEIAKNKELSAALTFDLLRNLYAAQETELAGVGQALDAIGDKLDALLEQVGRIETGVVEIHAVAVETHGAVLDLQGELQRLGSLHLANTGEVRTLLEMVLVQLGLAGMVRGEVRPGNSCSIRGEDARRAVKAVKTRVYQLSEADRRQVPALLNGLGKLQHGAGDLAEARQTFTEVGQVVTDTSSKAEAFFNAYWTALEEKQWEPALVALREACSLDPQRFAPFPLHRYEPERILGAGGFGTAVLCRDRHFDEYVVAKTLHAADMARTMQEVFREARILHRLSHPAIIGVRDCEYADPDHKARPYLVMEYFDGGTLQQFVEERGPLGLEQLLSVSVQVAEGMKAAHAQGVWHRDLKPANVLVHQEGNLLTVKIIDFGLALRQQTVEASRVRIGAQQKSMLDWTVAGTLDYAPPEQLGKWPGVGPGPYSDVFAFGKTCSFAMFKATELLRRQWNSLPGSLADLLEECLDPDPRKRPQGFEPVLAVLRECSRVGEEARLREQEERLRLE